MKNPARILAPALVVLALAATATFARAQVLGVSVKAPANPRIRIESGDVATLAFSITNAVRDTVRAEPRINAPAGWRVVMSPSATILAPGQQEVWLVSVKSPASIAAGDYAIRVGAEASSDSVVVTIAERRGVALSAINTLSYIMGGKSYEGRFLLQNLGNVAARFEISAKSTHGESPLLPREVFALAPGQTDTVIAKVTIPNTIRTTVEEVLLLSAIDVVVDTVRSEASLQATVVPPANNGPSMWTVPAEIALRTAAPGTGVSAFTAAGTGRLTQTSDVYVDFQLRGPTGKIASFGEQETYRVALSSKLGRVRLGDHSFGFSSLLTSGGRGTGAEARTEWNGLVGGAYVQRNRSNGLASNEASVMLGTDERKAVSGTVVALNRASTGGSAQVVATAGRASIGGAHIDLEIAASDSLKVAGNAGAARISGATSLVSYDVSASHASTRFASLQQGASDFRASVVGRRVGSTVLTASTTMHRTNPAARADSQGQRIAMTTVAANWTGITAEFEHIGRADVGGPAPIVGNMETLRLRGRYVLGQFEGSLNLKGSLTAEPDSAKTRSSTGVGAAMTAHIGENQFVSLFADYVSGRGLAESGMASTTGGANAELHVRQTTIRLMSTVSTQASAVSRIMTNSDLMMERAVRSVTLGLRARLSTVTNGPTTHGVFFEIKRPFGIPTARVNDIGRARVEIVDAETGKGVAGALIRVGGQAGVTDLNGVATFRDLKPGEYRAIVDGAAVAGRVVATSATVNISATSRKPAEVRMSLTRGARVIARVRSFERGSALATSGDTLTEVGAVGGVPVALVTPGDTVWQTSDERGRVDFGSIAPGRYTVAIPRYSAPDRMALAQATFEIEVGAGENRQVDFKLIPQVRAIEFVGETILIAAPVKAQEKPAAAGPATITSKPQPTTVTGKPLPQGQRQQEPR